MATVESTAVIELHCENRDGRVRVVLPNKHIMAMPVQTAVDACRAFNQQILFKDQFDLLLDHLAEWIDGHCKYIKDAYLTTRDSGLLFLVVTKSRRFVQEFEDELTSLDIDLANDDDYSLIRINTLAIPPVGDEATRSFSSKFVFRFRLNGDRSNTHPSGESNSINDRASSE